MHPLLFPVPGCCRPRRDWKDLLVLLAEPGAGAGSEVWQRPAGLCHRLWGCHRHPAPSKGLGTHPKAGTQTCFAPCTGNEPIPSVLEDPELWLGPPNARGGTPNNSPSQIQTRWDALRAAPQLPLQHLQTAQPGGENRKKKQGKRQLYFCLTFNNLYCPPSSSFPSQEWQHS